MLELSDTQRQAVESNELTILVSGGPGTGKTRLITERFAHLVDSKRAAFSSILALTFSSASAAGLRESIEKKLNRSYDELWVRTYQSFAISILEENSNYSFASPPTLTAPFKEYLLVREILKKEQKNLRSEFRRITSVDGLAREMVDVFGLLKQNGIPADEFSNIAKGLSRRLQDIGLMYMAVEKNKRDTNWIGPRDVVRRAIVVLEDNKALLEHYQKKFDHILVDEFQEIDPAQLRLLLLLASKDTSLFFCGDMEQRIYRFRGSMIGQYEAVTSARPKTKVIRLEKSYRLAEEIERASKNLIGHNSGSADEKSDMHIGGRFDVVGYPDPIEQAYEVARQIKGSVLDSMESDERLHYSDFAIICRSSARSALPIEEAFSYYDIPYTLHNSTSFYKHSMARCIIELIKLLVQPDDDDALLRVLRTPAFGLDAVEISRLANGIRRGRDGELHNTLIRLSERNQTPSEFSGLSEKSIELLVQFVSYFLKIQQQALEADCPSAVIHSMMSSLFFKEILDKDDIAAGVRDAQNLRLVMDVISDIEESLTRTHGTCSLADIAEYLEHACAHFSSFQENDAAGDTTEAAKIMTVHQAKGKEFPFVYLIDMTDEYFPLLGRFMSSLDGLSLRQLSGALEEKQGPGISLEGGIQFVMDAREQLEEERQLAYVAMSRASRKLTICYTEESLLSESVQPSPFIRETLGREMDVYPLDSDANKRPADGRALLDSATNQQEIESALRACLQESNYDKKTAEEIIGFVESLDLDAHFICDDNPFTGEPTKKPALTERRYSASQLSTYLSCPRKFFFEKMLRIAPDRPEDFGLGQLIHLVLEKFHRQFEMFSGDPEILRRGLDDAFLAVWEDGRDGKNTDEPFYLQYPLVLQRTTIMRRARDILKRYLKTELARSSDKKILTCEKIIEFDVRDYPFVAMIDRIDAASDGQHVIDYKTSSSGPQRPGAIKKKFINIDDAEDYAPEDFQLPLYLMAARKAGYDPTELVYYWLAQKYANGEFKRASVCIGEGDSDFLSAKEVKAVENSIVSIIKRIETGEFPPNPRKAYDCTRCSFDAICDNRRLKTNTEND